MPTYEYICRAGHTTEARAGYGDNTPLSCSSSGCGLLSLRRSVYLVNPRGLADTHTPLDERRVKFSRFREAGQEAEYAFHKVESDCGHELKRPPYFREGVRRAHEVAAGLRPPPKERF